MRVAFSKYWWIILLIMFIIPVVLLYIYVLHPIVGTPFMEFKQYRGEEYYKTDKYLTFEDGLQFQKALNTYDFLEGISISDFYYSDNRWKDSVVYGKRPDVYGVMLDAEEDFGEIKTIVEATGYLDTKTSFRDTDKILNLYVMPQIDNDNVLSIFVICDEIEYLSYIMVTEIESDSQSRTYSSVYDVLKFWSTLPFE